MNDCLFCKIVAGDIPAELVFEDAKTIALLDITPVNPGHVLVVPKSHARNIFDISASDWQAVMETARKLAPAVQEASGAEGLNIHVNNEPSAGQIIFHAHAHIIPRFEGDGREHWHGVPAEQSALRAMRDRIIAAAS